MKGFRELVEGYLALPEETRMLLRIDLAGKFGSETEKAQFLREISATEKIRYHGVVDGPTKRNLLAEAHVFCLPTSFLEGQPISILEAYAAGCVVLATLRGGIPDIFEPGRNGFAIQDRSAGAVRRALASLPERIGELQAIALGNRLLAAQKYRSNRFCWAIRQILEGTAERKTWSDTGAARGAGTSRTMEWL